MKIPDIKFIPHEEQLPFVCNLSLHAGDAFNDTQDAVADAVYRAAEALKTLVRLPELTLSPFEHSMMMISAQGLSELFWNRFEYKEKADEYRLKKNKAAAPMPAEVI